MMVQFGVTFWPGSWFSCQALSKWGKRAQLAQSRKSFKSGLSIFQTNFGHQTKHFSEFYQNTLNTLSFSFINGYSSSILIILILKSCHCCFKHNLRSIAHYIKLSLGSKFQRWKGFLPFSELT